MLTQFISDMVIFFSSMVKFGLGATAVVGADMGIGGTICNILGGICGIVVFTHLGEFIRSWLLRTYPNKFNKRFTRVTRMLVRVKQNFGLTGIAFITPVILSIPVGVFFALDLTSHKRKVMTQMIAACLFWSLIFFVPYYVFDINIIGWLKQRF